MLRLARVAGLGICAALSLTSCGFDDVTAPATDGGVVEVAVLGLPSGAPAAITVSGSGATHTLTSTGTLRLPPGTYTLNAGAVQAGPVTWYPNLASQSVLVAEGQTWSTKVRYGTLAVAGTYVAQLELFDSAMVSYMSDRHIGAGTLAISRQGEIVYRRAFGWRDSARTDPLSPHALMRLASNSKPVTSAAIRRLVTQGRLTLDTKVFALLGLTPAGGSVTDARIFDISVQHLLDHTGGWNRSIAGDIMFKAREISLALGISTPPSKTQIARWVMTQPLQHTPGTATAYSNFGYLLLGLVVEKVTGQNFIDHVTQNFFSGSAASEVISGRSLRTDRDAREPFYADPYKGCSVFNVQSCVLVPWPDGGWYLEAFDSCGGLVASAPAMAQFLENYWINGQPRVPGTTGGFTFYGSLDGTFTLTRQRTDGVSFVALFNQRTDASGLPYEEIQQILDGVGNRLFASSVVAKKN